jgi:hypothetical protein
MLMELEIAPQCFGQDIAVVLRAMQIPLLRESLDWAFTSAQSKVTWRCAYYGTNWVEMTLQKWKIAAEFSGQEVWHRKFGTVAGSTTLRTFSLPEQLSLRQTDRRISADIARKFRFLLVAED